MCWIFRYAGVKGNERGDSGTTTALYLAPNKSKIPYTDLKAEINLFIHTKWLNRWNNNDHYKLYNNDHFHFMKLTLGD